VPGRDPGELGQRLGVDAVGIGEVIHGLGRYPVPGAD
jgi:hypothetical protein